MKKLIALLCAALMVASMAACAPANETTDDGKYVVGICEYMPHPALDQATAGFKAAVIAGLGEENVTFEIGNAAGEATNCTSIVTDLISKKVDLIMANATPSLVAAANATETIPILGTSVTEYGVALGIENFSGTVGGNVSGTSDLADLEKQAQMIIDWCPTAKKVGLLYCSAEPNSQYQVDKVQAYLESKNIECKQFGFADTNDLTAVTTTAADWADAIYVPTDNVVANNAAGIYDICKPKNVPIIAGEEGICSGCGIATMSISYYDLGYTTGEMAVKILKGEAKIAEMPIGYAPAPTYKYNETICQEMNIQPLDGYVKIG